MTNPVERAATDHLLSTTRSVRKRFDLERPVDREVLLECIELAQQAPTGSNAQGWRFVVITDQAIRNQLALIYRQGASAYLAASAAREQTGQSRRVFESARFLADNLERVPVHVIPCIYGRAEVGSNVAAAGLYASIIPAAWSFMLALRSRGLGSVWTTLHLNCEQETAEVLGIPEGVTQAGLIPVGYYTGTDFKPVSRPPAQEITYWDRWNNEMDAGK